MRHIQSFCSVSASWLIAAALAGWAGCGFSSSGASGNNVKMDASIDSPDVDAMVVPPVDAPPGLTCYGPTGWQACFTSPPSGDVVLPTPTKTINTDGGAPCLAMQPMGWIASQPAACFIVGDTITVPSNGTIVNGAKPLVLVAKSLITVSGALDVASHLGDPGTKPSECQAFSQTPNMPGTSGGGGGGGAGGSFMTKAGNGGNGDNATQSGQASLADAMAPPHLRGGCPGQVGGANAGGDAGKVGFGGGSIYLISGGEIVLQNSINASGAGAGGGKQNSAGGSGGGSGGMIVLYAGTLTIPIPVPPAVVPVLMANGGGGGGGATQNTNGGNGSDPLITSPTLSTGGGGGANGAGGNGGKGYPVLNSTDVNGGGGSAGTGGGGGGGGGAAGYIRSNKPLMGAMVSPPVDIVP